MKNLRFVHIADIHADGDTTRQKKLQSSFDQLLGYCDKVKNNNSRVNAVIIAGDVFEKKQSYADKSGVPMVQIFLKKLSWLVDAIFIVKGNNAHDEPGSIALLHQMESNIFAYEYPVVLHVATDGPDLSVADILRNPVDFVEDKPDYIISLMPYPTKASLLKDAGIDENNENFVDVFSNILSMMGDTAAQFNCPKIMGFHGNVQGSRLSTGQTLISQDLMVAPFTLYQAKADYYALGHIHLRQMVADRMWYSGGLYNCNWGETEQKSFNVIEFDAEGNMAVEIVPLTAARPMITIDHEFKPSLLEMVMSSRQKLALEEIEAIAQERAEVRLKIKVNENDRKLITDSFIEDIKNEYGSDVKIDLNIIPAERDSRSEKIMECRTVVDEVKEYAAVINYELTDSLIDKVRKVEGQEVVF